jgi:hypothetical protein
MCKAKSRAALKRKDRGAPARSLLARRRNARCVSVTNVKKGKSISMKRAGLYLASIPDSPAFCQGVFDLLTNVENRKVFQRSRAAFKRKSGTQSRKSSITM